MFIRKLILALSVCLFVHSAMATAAATTTGREIKFSNDKVIVWETTVLPGANQGLKKHRHDHDRVVVAFDDGVLKVTNDKGQMHYLKLQKNTPYYLSKDVPNELHTDDNITNHPIKVLVVEFKN